MNIEKYRTYSSVCERDCPSYHWMKDRYPGLTEGEICRTAWLLDVKTREKMAPKILEAVRAYFRKHGRDAWISDVEAT